MNKIITLLSFLFVTGGLTVYAQTGSLAGTITEELDGKLIPVPFANVVLMETLQGTTTNFDGGYKIDGVKPGTYSLVVSFIGYKPDTTKITVADGENKTVNKTVGKNMEMLEEFQIEAKVSRESANVLLMEQKNATEIKQSIGAVELEKKGVSDVATGLTKVTGISLVEGKSMFVRGLGDRYNLATWNGALLASPNPDQKVIPLDLFPTDIVSNLAIDKVFSPRYFSDYAGARIDIVSKDYPEEPLFKVELGTSINTRTTFQDFEGRRTGKYEYLGYDGGNRDLPNEIASISNNQYETPRLENTQYPYTTGLNNNVGKAMPATSIGVSGGNYYKVGDEGGIGFLLLANFDNKYQNKEGVDRVLKADRAVMTDYKYKSSEYTTNTTTYGNLYFKLNKKHSISLNGLFLNSSENNATSHSGYNNDQSRNLITSRNPYFQDQMYNVQLVGKHKLLSRDKLIVTWNGSYSKAKNEEKDRNQLVWLQNDNQSYEFNTLDLAANHRWWSQLDENQTNFNADVEYKFKYASEENNNSNQGRLYVGYNYLNKDREFDWRQVNYRIDRTDSLSPLLGEVNYNNPDGYLNQPNYDGGYYDFKEQSDPSSNYFGNLNIMAGYVNVDYYLVPDKLQLMVGVRVEKSKQMIRYKKLGDRYSDPFRVNIIDTLNFLPSLGGKYVVNKTSNIRFAFSQTMSRPMFREMAPIQYLPYFGGVQEQGNENLKNGYIYNGDIKYEWFPNYGEMIAVTVFGKYLNKPIERIRMEAATPLATYINTDKAYVAGIELEVTKNLGNIIKVDSGWVKNVLIGFNASYLYSQIIIDTTNSTQGNINVTNVNRQLQGASPFLLNADLTYRQNWKDVKVVSDFTLSYNLSGKRITEAGVFGLPDIYERPVNTLNFIWKNRIKENFTVDFKVYNILDPNIQKIQEFSDKTEVVSSYQLGMTFAVKLGYTF
tara:strand:+ start:1568 stop:4393 length:2826 start_codon:yes stop_codon:yes gene_type:complete